MKSRDNTSAVIKALRKEHGLLAAFLEAADKLDCRALNRRVAMAKPINVGSAPGIRFTGLAPSRAGSFVLNSSTRQPDAGF
jgi:hypothetical protein